MPFQLPPDKSVKSLIGDPDAENERDGLAHYFVPQPVVRDILRGEKTHIFGRKGVGKTALAMRVAAEAQRWKWITADVAPPDQRSSWFPEGARDKEGYRQRWWVLLAALAIKAALPNGLGNGLQQALDRYLSRVGLPSRKKERKKYLDRVDTLSFAVLQVEASLTFRSPKEDEPAAALEEAEAREIVDLAIQWLEGEDRRVFISVDNVDKRPEAGAHFYAYLMGLCLAANEIRNATKGRITVAVYIRDDFARGVFKRFHETNRFEGQVFKLKWTGEALMDVIGTRLAHGTPSIKYNLSLEFESKRDMFFSEKGLHYYLPLDVLRHDQYVAREHLRKRAWWYLMERGMLRPRDLIRFMGAVFGFAREQNKDRITQYELNGGERRYSERLLEDISAEYLYLFESSQDVDSAIYLFLQKFQGELFRFTRTDLIGTIKEYASSIKLKWAPGGELVHKEPEELIPTLYQMGFIVEPLDRDFKNLDFGLPFRAYHNSPDLDLDAVTHWELHPGVRKVLLHGYGQEARSR